ncbi:MAG: MFS transporter, partial [Candidatus Thermoplasmatota archaeon]|nr:MFS transporter [Candidatus Thermoplasmatota archaeon]
IGPEAPERMAGPEGLSHPAAANVHPLRNRAFLLVWLGQTVSLIGSGISYIAIVWWVFEETGSIVIMATVAIASTIPRLLAGPFAGAYVDRWDRRKVMLVLDAAAGVVMAVIASLLAFNALQVWHLYAFTGIIGFGVIFHATALLASVPNLVHKEQLSRANSLMQLSHGASGVLGPAIGGVLIVFLGVSLTLWVDAATFLFASAMLLIVAFPSPRLKTDKTVLADISTGFGFLRRRPALLTLLGLFAVTNFFIAPLIILLPVVASGTLRMGSEGFGLLFSSLSAGLLGGSIIFAAVKLRRHFGLYIIGAIAGFGAAYVLFGWSTFFFLSIAGLGAMGFAVSLASIASATVFQREVPLELQGRVFSARAVLAQGLQPASLAVVGVLAERLGAQTVLMWSGALIVVVALLTLASASVRKL